MPLPFRYEDQHPPARVLARAWSNGGSRQLFAGGRGSGAAFHFHNPAYNVQFFGTKQWMLTPPRHAGITGSASTHWSGEQVPTHFHFTPSIHTSLHTLYSQLATAKLPAHLPLRCTQGPGDMILLPGHWGHATVSTKFSIGIGNLYCDTTLANLTNDPKCRRFYPRVPRGTPPSVKSKVCAPIADTAHLAACLSSSLCFVCLLIGLPSLLQGSFSLTRSPNSFALD